MVEKSEGKSSFPGRGSAPGFAEIVGQTDLKEALLATAANDALDGLLIRGEKGTAKSTAVRALADLLPTQAVIEGCPYGCPPGVSERQCSECRERTSPSIFERRVPLVTVPLGATRERVVGTLSVADALAGKYEFDPGLLARANRGLLYVDEVNLLDDHLVDVLLDAAASGVNRVERDGVSLTHPADFTLVGTMNPEEGDLRPQLRDRFALGTTVTGCAEIDQRVAIVEQALGTDSSVPVTTAGRDGDREAAADGGHGQGDRALDPGSRLRRARERLDEVELPGDPLERITKVCRDAGIEGHRGDIATARASRTLAALDGRPTVLDSDVRRAAELALSHRLRSRPFEDAPDPETVIDEHFDDEDAEPERDEVEGEASDGDGAGETTDESDRGSGAGDDTDADADGRDDSVGGPAPSSGDRGRDGGGLEASEGNGGNDEANRGNEACDESEGSSGNDGRDEDDPTDATPLLPGQSAAAVGDGRAPDLSTLDTVGDGHDDRGTSGSRARARPSVAGEGPRVRTERADETDRVDAAASIRAASARGASTVESRDLRRSVRRSEARGLVLFVVDASASMRPAMRAAKGVGVELLKETYRNRDEVGFVTFAGEGAEVLLPPTNSVTLAARHLKDLPTGDRTPLPAGLRIACEVLERADPSTSVVVVVTDGRANVAENSPVSETRAAARELGTAAGHTVVVDAGEDDRTGLAGLVAEETGGERVPLGALSADRIDRTVGATRKS